MKYTKNLRIDGDKVYSYVTHVATMDHTNRLLLVHGYWSPTTSKHLNHVAAIYNLKSSKAPKPAEESHSSGLLKSVAMVAAFGNILCDSQKDKNAWKLRMLKAGLENQGLDIPNDFDSLPEEEKTRRLDGALAAIS
jgi:hypothetical protein